MIQMEIARRNELVNKPEEKSEDLLKAKTD
jgi:hypothetical protein